MKIRICDGGRARAGFENEKNDCTVRAAVVRFTTSYERAHALAESAGRRLGRGLKLSQTKELLANMGLDPVMPLESERPTVNQFIKDNPRGRFYVVIRGHAFGIDNGVIVDNHLTPTRARVWLYA